MTTIDARGNLHDSSGQFAEKRNSAPATTLAPLAPSSGDDPSVTQFWDREPERKVYPDGTVQYEVEGIVHRLDGPAIENPGGTTAWYREGRLHREGGPAVESPAGYSAYYRDGRLHREDGPAVTYTNGEVAHYLDGVKVAAPEADRAAEPAPPAPGEPGWTSWDEAASEPTPF